jgi:iron complex outermembrane receptor protein
MHACEWRSCLSVASVVLVSSLMISPPAYGASPAQKPVAASGQSPLAIEEVIVTARRKEENLQVVPVSVTVISGKVLEERGIADLTSLQQRVPSLRIQASDVNPKAFLVGIRGLKSASYAAMEDPVAGTYFDEVVQAHPYGFGSTLFDLQSVQVLKGPQGTLFGRNHTAGAILIESNKAQITDGTEGYAKVGLGDFKMKEFEGVANLPINDMSALRVAYRDFKRDGYTRNILNGQLFDGSDEKVLRLSYLIKPTRSLSSHFVYDYLLDEGGPTSVMLSGLFLPQVSAANRAVFGPALARQQALGPRQFAYVPGTGIGGTGNTTAPGNDMLHPAQCLLNPGNTICRKHAQPIQEIVSKGILNNTAWELDNGITIKNIIGYRKVSHVLEASNVASAVPVASPVGVAFMGVQENKQNQMSEELQFSGKAFDDKLDWIAGYFWFRERFSEYAPSFQFSQTTYNKTQSKGENKATAVFAQGTYKLTDQWKLTVGMRANKDKRMLDNFSRNAWSVATGLPGTCQFTENFVNFPATRECRIKGEKTWSANTWNLSLDYQMDADTLIYLTTRKGYKSGGFARNSNLVERATYNPEFVRDIEFGIKSDAHWGAMPVRTNFAIYNSDVTNLQVGNAVGNPVTGVFFTYTNNAGKAQVNGFELEMTLLPTDRLELNGSLSYTKPKYKEYMAPNNATRSFVDFSGVPFGGNQAVPKWQGALAASYRIPTEANGEIRITGDFTFRSRAPTDNAKYYAQTGGVFNPQMEDAGRGLLNLRADWKEFLGNKPITASVFINNVSDRVYKDGGTQAIGLMSAHYAAPRMFGVEVSYTFGKGSD